MALKQDTTSEGLPLNVTNDIERTDHDEPRYLQYSLNQENDGQNSTKNRRRTLSKTTNLGIKKRKREGGLENDEETMLRDRLLDELDSVESPQSFEHQTVNQTSNKDMPIEEAAFIQERKIIKLKGRLPNLALPEGWLALNHRSGGIIYLHRSSRVCTWSRPYYIGKGSVRKHDVPIAAIPCLHQKKALESESKLKNDFSVEQQIRTTCNSESALNFINTAGVGDSETHQNDTEMKRKGVSGSHDEKQKIDANNIGASGVDDVASNLGGVAEIGSSDDGITDSTSTHGCGSYDEEDDDDICDQNIIPNTFHPKDGLDVVNDSLSVDSVHSLQKTQNSSTNLNEPSQNEVLNSSSKLETNTVMQETALEERAEPSECLLLKDQLCGGKNNSRSKPVDATDIKVNNDDENGKRTKKEFCDGDKITLIQSENLESSENKARIDIPTQMTDQNSKPDCAERAVSKTHMGIELVDAEELSVYLERLFEFEELTQEQEQNVAMTSVDQSSEQGESSLPPLLECLPYCVKGISAKQNKEWVLNPGGKTPIAILHEYSQAVLKEKPEYVCSECDNPSTPFVAEVQINGITHGTGVASSKKQAKQAAAEATLQVFLPDVFKKIRDYQISAEELEYFDNLRIDHPSVYELSIKSGLPSPSQLLQECLKRNQGVCSSVINFKIIPGENQNHSYKISCGKHTAEGFCKNKKTGKQLASQALLKKLHPKVSTWGSLLRIYCDRPSSIVKKYKATTEDDGLSKLQQCFSGDTPKGGLVLARLKEEMKKMADEEKQGRKRRPQTKDYTHDNTNPISTVDF